MARPQAFDHEMVLDSAMQLFWRKGYATTSIKNLSDVTRLQPGSLYGAFKNKRNLFLESLDYYFENLYAGVSCILQSEETPLLRIRHFFDFLLNQTIEDKDQKSCLLVNTLLEIPPDDSEINLLIASMFAQIEQLFCNVLVEAQQDKTLVAEEKPAEIAKMLMSGIFGLHVYNRMHPDPEALKQIVNNLLNVLEQHK